MGAWGRGHFENDGAHDWLFERNDVADDAIVCRAAFDAVVENADYLEVDEGQHVVAAALLMASGHDGDRDGLPDGVEWRGATPSADDRSLAARALTRILEAPTSEIAELWDEAPEGALWRVGIAALRARLSRPGGAS